MPATSMETSVRSARGGRGHRRGRRPEPPPPPRPGRNRWSWRRPVRCDRRRARRRRPARKRPARRQGTGYRARDRPFHHGSECRFIGLSARKESMRISALPHKGGVKNVACRFPAGQSLQVSTGRAVCRQRIAAAPDRRPGRLHHSPARCGAGRSRPFDHQPACQGRALAGRAGLVRSRRPVGRQHRREEVPSWRCATSWGGRVGRIASSWRNPPFVGELRASLATVTVGHSPSGPP